MFHLRYGKITWFNIFIGAILFAAYYKDKINTASLESAGLPPILIMMIPLLPYALIVITGGYLLARMLRSQNLIDKLGDKQVIIGKILNILLILIVLGFIVVGSIFYATISLCKGQPTGCGDIILISFVVLKPLAFISTAYTFLTAVYIFISTRLNRTIPFRHFFALIIFIVLGLLLYFGPFRGVNVFF